jgi:anti-sigma regulatory factor (Ser/Thr protein kinase)
MRASIALCGVTAELTRLVAFAEAFARDCGFADDERARLLIILEELFTNVAAHGNAQSVGATLGLSRGRLTIDFVDDGPPFDPLTHPGPDLDAPSEERPIGGLGIAIVRGLVDTVRYLRQDSRNHLRLARRIAPAAKDRR